MECIDIGASRRYTVYIEDGLRRRAGELCRTVVSGDRMLLLTDETVGGLYLQQVKQSLEAAGFAVTPYVVTPGETSKSVSTYLDVIEALAAGGFTRSDAVVALGGGVVGDLGGFCAATYRRGIGFVQMPTTLLACVDSSVGGKTAVNLPQGKNLLGTFYQPWLVLCDPQVLYTLPSAVYADGMAEVIKYGMIRDRALFEELEKQTISNADIIRRCVMIKRDIVEADELDTGCRQLLNFGHTVGHAVEKCSGFAVSHGCAVAIGMAVITRALAAQGMLSADVYDRLARLLKAQGLPISCEFAASSLFAAAAADKKRMGETIALVTVTDLGEGVWQPIPMKELSRYIEMGLTV